MREFSTGATRDSEEGKPDYEGFLSPLVIQCFGKYMNKHRKQADGKLRDSDNWQQGIPLDAYMKSGWRHFFDWWLEHRGHTSREGLEDALCGLLFNVQGYLHELLKTPKEDETASQNERDARDWVQTTPWTEDQAKKGDWWDWIQEKPLKDSETWIREQSVEADYRKGAAKFGLADKYSSIGDVPLSDFDVLCLVCHKRLGAHYPDWTCP